MRAKNRSVVLAGDLDIYRATELRALLGRLAGPSIIDMRRVRYLDSSGLWELARTARRLGRGEITLLVGSENVLRVLGVVHFETMFVIVPALDAPRRVRATA